MSVRFFLSICALATGLKTRQWTFNTQHKSTQTVGTILHKCQNSNVAHLEKFYKSGCSCWYLLTSNKMFVYSPNIWVLLSKLSSCHGYQNNPILLFSATLRWELQKEKNKRYWSWSTVPHAFLLLVSFTSGSGIWASPNLWPQGYSNSSTCTTAVSPYFAALTEKKMYLLIMMTSKWIKQADYAARLFVLKEVFTISVSLMSTLTRQSFPSWTVLHTERECQGHTKTRSACVLI